MCEEFSSCCWRLPQLELELQTPTCSSGASTNSVGFFIGSSRTLTNPQMLGSDVNGGEGPIKREKQLKTSRPDDIKKTFCPGSPGCQNQIREMMGDLDESELM